MPPGHVILSPPARSYKPRDEGQDAPLQLEKAIVEVTNTPWGERVTFIVGEDGETLQKCLHVSPLMDMRSTWTVRAPAPRDTILLTVRCNQSRVGPSPRRPVPCV